MQYTLYLIHYIHTMFVPPPPDPDLFLKSARLQRLPSSASDLASNDLASLHETTKDPFTEGCACQRDGLTVIITACLTFATGVTVALIMQIYFGDPQVALYLCCFPPEIHSFEVKRFQGIIEEGITLPSFFFSHLLTHFVQGFQPGRRGDGCGSVYVSWL